MSHQYCFVCATDEGVFIDVTIDNNEKFKEHLEICSLIKEFKDKELISSKICHKCAFELNQCSLFVQKFKNLSKVQKQKLKKLAISCCLCSESPKTGCVFELKTNRNLLQNPIYKIQMLLNFNVNSKEEKVKSICLNCRYTIDLLFDLKCVYQTTQLNVQSKFVENIDYSNFPKTHTTVMNRKTTVTEAQRTLSLEISDSDSETNLMMRVTKQSSQKFKSKSSKKDNKQNDFKQRVCGKCCNSVEDGDDMYRFHATGLTVCKNCRIIANPSTEDPKKHSKKNSVETKSCVILLKDILSDSALKEQKIHKVGNENESNPVYIITDESSDSEDRLRKDPSMTEKPIIIELDNYVEKEHKKRVNRKKNVHLSAKFRNASPTGGISTRASTSKSNAEESDSINLRKRNSVQLNQNADSDPPSSIKFSKTNVKITNDRLQTSGESCSDVDVGNKRKRKKLRNVIEDTSTTNSAEEEASPSEELHRGRKRTKFAGASSVANDVDESKKRKRSSSSSEKDVAVQRKFKIPNGKRLATSIVTSSDQETSESKDEDKLTDEEKTNNEVKTNDEESIKEPEESIKKPEESIKKPEESIKKPEESTYVCEECGSSYENKLVGLVHKLTHFKQLELKLKKMVAAKETLESSKPLETISLTVDDDEEEDAVVEDSNKPVAPVSSDEIHSNVDNMEATMKETVPDETPEKEEVDTVSKKNLENQDTEEATVSATEDPESLASEKNKDDMTDERIGGGTQQEEKEEANSEKKDEDVSCNNEEKNNEETKAEDEENSQRDKETVEEDEKSKNIEEDKTEDEEKTEVAKEIVEDDEKSKNIEETQEDKEEGKSIESAEEKETSTRVLEDENVEKSTTDVEETTTKDGEREEEVVKSEEKEEDTKVEGKTKSLTESNDCTIQDEPKEVKEHLQNGIERKAEEVASVVEEVADALKYIDEELSSSKESNIVDSTNDIQGKTTKDESRDEEVTSKNVEITEEENFKSLDPRADKSSMESIDAAAEIIKKVLESATAEIRDKGIDSFRGDSDTETETLENISREVHKGDVVPSLEFNTLNSTDPIK